MVVWWNQEPTRQRAESLQTTNCEDHVAGKGFTSMSRYNLAHKFIPMPQAMKIPDAKSRSGQRMEKAIPAWTLDKFKSKKEVVLEAPTQIDMCHLKKFGVGTKITEVQRLLRGDTVKEDSGAYAVFTELGSSASQMTAAKKNGCHCKITEL